MAVMGTGIAAAVAQTHEAAREQKKTQAARRRDEAERARTVEKAYEVHLQSLEEGEGTQARLHADGQLDNEHDREPVQDVGRNAPHDTDDDAPPPRLDVEA